jgi:hypothetical protein
MFIPVRLVCDLGDAFVCEVVCSLDVDDCLRPEIFCCNVCFFLGAAALIS